MPILNILRPNLRKRILHYWINYTTSCYVDARNNREKFITLFERCLTGEGMFLPTKLYNEGWMLSLVINWFSTQGNHLLSFPENGKWHSEAIISATFLPRYRALHEIQSSRERKGMILFFQITSIQSCFAPIAD